MTTVVAPPPVKRRWKRRVLIVAASLLVVALGAYLWITIAARWGLAAVVAELDAADPGWRLAEIEASRAAVPDGENSALLIMALSKKSRGVSIHAALYNRIFKLPLPSTARLNAQQVQHLNARFALLGKVREEWRALKDMPRGRFPIRYAEDYFGTSLESTKSHEACEYLRHDAWLLAEEGKGDDAVANCRAMLNASRAIGDEPLLISLHRQNTFRVDMATTLERVLAQGEASEAELRATQELLEDESRRRLFTDTFRGERAGLYQLCLALQDGKADPRKLLGPAGRKMNFQDLIHELNLSYSRYYPGLIEEMTRLTEASKVPLHELVDAMEAAQKDFRTRGNYLSLKVVPSPRKMSRTYVVSHAMMRCAIAGIACERYRLVHKQWPASLDALVQAKLLDAAPEDPFDAKPLRFLRTKEGLTIYSIGLDRVDNQGNIDRVVNDDTPGTDVGFRLWDVAGRRRAPLPLVPLTEDE